MTTGESRNVDWHRPPYNMTRIRSEHILAAMAASIDVSGILYAALHLRRGAMTPSVGGGWRPLSDEELQIGHSNDPGQEILPVALNLIPPSTEDLQEMTVTAQTSGIK